MPSKALMSSIRFSIIYPTFLRARLCPLNLLSSDGVRYLDLTQSPAFTQICSQSTIPETAAEFHPQYEAFCRVANLEPASPTILRPSVIHHSFPVTTPLHFIETDQVAVENGTYQGRLDATWIPTPPDPMTWQRSRNLTRKL